MDCHRTRKAQPLCRRLSLTTLRYNTRRRQNLFQRMGHRSWLQAVNATNSKQPQRKVSATDCEARGTSSDVDLSSEDWVSGAKSFHLVVWKGALLDLAIGRILARTGVPPGSTNTDGNGTNGPTRYQRSFRTTDERVPSERQHPHTTPDH